MQQRPGSRSCAKSTVAPEGTSADKHGAAGVDPNPRSNSLIPFRRATNLHAEAEPLSRRARWRSMKRALGLIIPTWPYRPLKKPTYLSENL